MYYTEVIYDIKDFEEIKEDRKAYVRTYTSLTELEFIKQAYNVIPDYNILYTVKVTNIKTITEEEYNSQQNQDRSGYLL